MNYKIFLAFILVVYFSSCGIYSFTGVSISPDIKTIQVNDIFNLASIVNPKLAYQLKIALEDKFINQTNLKLVKKNGDLLYEISIIRYEINMSSVTQTAVVQNRFTIEVKLNFFNNIDKTKNFERQFSHYVDFETGRSIMGSFEQEQVDLILQKIISDIYIASLADW